MLFESIDLKDTKAQKEAFADTWSNVKYQDQLGMIQSANLDLWKYLHVLDTITFPKSSIAYLSTMALRIFLIHRKLKKTGSFYLHCDPTMSHYLKAVCDLVFGSVHFKNEIVWKRTSAHNTTSRKFGAVTDSILYYTKSGKYTFNAPRSDHSEEYINKFYRFTDGDGRKFRLHSIERNPALGIRKNLIYEYNNFTPQYGWMMEIEKLEALDKAGKLVWSSKGRPSRKIYLDEVEDPRINSLWSDVASLSGLYGERMEYNTQKPESLLERIISTSTHEGDLVADFFCGCGTAVAVAQRLNRNWIGVDISHLAVRLIYNRVLEPYKQNPEKFREIKSNIEVNGFPRDIASAHELATGSSKGRIKFQDWVIEFMMNGVSRDERRGFDGYMTMARNGNKKDIVLIEVKSGATNVEDIREFAKAVSDEKAVIGVFVCFASAITKPMSVKAAQEGYFEQDLFGTKFPRIQILTIEELLEGKTVLHPNPAVFNVTFKKAY